MLNTEIAFDAHFLMLDSQSLIPTIHTVNYLPYYAAFVMIVSAVPTGLCQVITVQTGVAEPHGRGGRQISVNLLLSRFQVFL